ncbi:MAG: protein FxsA [Actinomycetota bacterium]
MLLLALIFIVVPIAELAVLIKVGSVIGVLNTIGLLLAVSIVGGWLVKREGLGVLNRMREQVNNHRVPGAELIDAFLVMMAGALLITPGFLSDVVGIFLLLPPVRALVRRRLRRRFETRIITIER